MAMSHIRSRFLTARLLTMLLPGMALLTPNVITPISDFGIIAPLELPKSERWSRSTFELFRAEEIPWDELAFRSTREALREYLDGVRVV